MHAGLLYATLAFAIWGLFPLYFRQLATVAPLEVVLHRSAWSLAFLVVLLAAMGRLRMLREVFAERRRTALFALSASLLACNWLVYVLAMQWGRVVEASLGFFINPLVNVLLGVLVLHERLRPLQWLAVALAAVGVGWMTWQGGTLPWMALALATTFGAYGLIRKTATLGALEGLALESLLLAPVVLPALAWASLQPGGGLARGDAGLTAWLLAAGPLTVLPLLLFTAGARRLPLSTLGLVQYLAPTLTLLLGVLAFGEPFDRTRLVGFGFIWGALALLSVEAIVKTARARRPDASP